MRGDSPPKCRSVRVLFLCQRLASAVLLVGLVASGCGSGYSSAVVATLTGVSASAGGGYQIELREPNGELLAGTSGVFVDFQPDDQVVTVVLENGALFAKKPSFQARLYVEAWAGDNGPVIALGNALLTLEQGKVAEQTVSLVADPRPVELDATGQYLKKSDGRLFGRLTADLDTAPTDPYTFHFWAKSGASTSWLAAFADTSEPWEAVLPGAEFLVDRDNESFVVTLEPGDDDTQLARSNGWEVAAGQLSETARTAFEPALDADGSVAGLLALAAATARHAGFAKDAIDEGNNDSAKAHAEHVYNIASGSGAEKTFADGTADYADVTDKTGINTYRSQAFDVADSAAEIATADDGLARGATVANIGSCSTRLGQAVADVRTAVDAFMATTNEQIADTIVAAGGRLLGDPFDASASDETRQTAQCMADRIDALTAFRINTVPAAAP